MSEEQIQQEKVEKQEALESEKIAEQIEQLGDKLTGDDEPAKHEEVKADVSQEGIKPESEKTELDKTASEVVEAEDSEDMPENPGKDWFIKERKKRQEERRRREEAEAKIALYESERQKQPERAEVPKQQLPPEEVFRLLVKAQNNEFTDDPQRAMSAAERNRQIVSYANKVIEEEFSSEELKGVMKQAESGMFGEYSQNVADAVSRAFPLVMTREMNERKVREDRERQYNEQAKTSEEEIKKLAQDPLYKDMADSKTELGQHLIKWEKEWIGTVTDGKFLPANKLPPAVVQQLIMHPALRAELARKDFLATRYDSVVSERDKYKTIIERSRQPEGGSKPGTEVKSGMLESDAVLEEIESQFGKLT